MKKKTYLENYEPGDSKQFFKDGLVNIEYYIKKISIGIANLFVITLILPTCVYLLGQIKTYCVSVNGSENFRLGTHTHLFFIYFPENL